MYNEENEGGNKIMEEDKRIIEIHYNVFETLEEQLKAQNYKGSDLETFEITKNNILYLWFNNILTNNEKDKCINKLHKQIITKIRKEN